MSKMAADLELILPSMKSLNSCISTEGQLLMLLEPIRKIRHEVYVFALTCVGGW